MHTMQLMVEQERRYVEQLRQELVASKSNSKIGQDLESATKRLNTLQQQLEAFRKVKLHVLENQTHVVHNLLADLI